MITRYVSTIHELGNGDWGRVSKMAGYSTHKGARKVAIRRGYKFPICVVVREYELRDCGERLISIVTEFKLEN